MDNFVTHWCHLSANRDHHAIDGKDDEQNEVVKKTEDTAQKLRTAIKEHQGIRELAENPLLPTLLTVMQQNSVELPRQRIELYTVVARTLLENRNLAKGLQAIPESTAIERLGPIAFQMQETENSFVHKQDVMSILNQAISMEGGTDDQITQESEQFLVRIRERGGLFVHRTGDYFGFIHRSFQEYFAARYMLNQIDQHPDRWIPELTKRAHYQDALRREPFLLAVAYKSGENKFAARQILQIFLAEHFESDAISNTNYLLLAAECIIESKPLALGLALEKQVAEQLIEQYEKAQRARRAETCEQIEERICRWLLSLPAESYRPVILTVLVDGLHTQEEAYQQSILTLLTMIIRRLKPCPALVFDALVPPLLAIADLPSFGGYLPSTEFSPANNLINATLATTILSFINRYRRNRSVLTDIHRYIEMHPSHFRILVRTSLESQTLLLPTALPQTVQAAQHYLDALRDWLTLCDHVRVSSATEQQVDRGVVITHTLLYSAEEAVYPGMAYFINLLQEGAKDDRALLQDLCQTYMSRHLASGSTILYQEMVLLWLVLFSETQEIKKLATLIEQHIYSAYRTTQCSAMSFLVLLTFSLQQHQEEKFAVEQLGQVYSVQKEIEELTSPTVGQSTTRESFISTHGDWLDSQERLDELQPSQKTTTRMYTSISTERIMQAVAYFLSRGKKLHPRMSITQIGSSSFLGVSCRSSKQVREVK
jgi:hypothetical protein